LGQELLEMPVEEVVLLPPDLKPWVKGIREKFLNESYIEPATPPATLKDHSSRLSTAAEKLSTQLFAIHLGSSDLYAMLVEEAVDNNNFTLLKLLENDRIKCLLTHMQAEIPSLKRVTKWDDLLVKEITSELIDKLDYRAEHGNFVGKCEDCKNLE
jgi:hypothetical protein